MDSAFSYYPAAYLRCYQFLFVMPELNSYPDPHDLPLPPSQSCIKFINSSGLPWWLRRKESACNAGDLPLGQKDPLGEENGSLFQYSRMENHGQRSLEGCSLQGHKESDRSYLSFCFLLSSSSYPVSALSC